MKRKTKRRYCYLLERKTDGKHFCAFGNFKATSYGQHPCVLFDLLPETYTILHDRCTEFVHLIFNKTVMF